MKIPIEIPDWAIDEKRTIYILAGMEEVAHKPHGKSWEVKTTRCNMCGKCCMNVPDNWSHGSKEGKCKHLVYRANEYICGLGENRPFQCCIGDDAGEDYCVITWETQ